MSYDLCFWAERPGLGLPAQMIYEHLLHDKQVDGLVPFAVEAYLAALAEAFPDGTREPNGPSEWFVWEGGDSMFEVWFSPVHVLAMLRPFNESNANLLIDIAVSFGIFLYDPQTGERFAPPVDRGVNADPA